MVFFAHVILPHNPYVYDEECEVRPARLWRFSRNHWNESRHKNSPELRRIRYADYLAQVACVGVMIDGLLAALEDAGVLKDVMIVFHGDHGSRVNLVDPAVEGDKSYGSARDYVDQYSTLFAVRLPHGKNAGYDNKLRPIQELLAETMEREPEQSGTPCETGDCVFVGGRDRLDVRRLPSAFSSSGS